VSVKVCFKAEEEYNTEQRLRLNTDLMKMNFRAKFGNQKKKYYLLEEFKPEKL